MCGISAVGSQSTLAANTTTLGSGGSASSTTTGVAGASGGGPVPGAVAGATGGAGDLSSIIAQLTASIGALQQALQGGGLVEGGGPGAPAGHGAGCGCGMPGCGGTPTQAPPSPEQAPPPGDKGDKGGKADKADKADKPEKPGRGDKDRADKADKADKRDRSEGKHKPERRPAQDDVAQGGDRAEGPEGAKGAPSVDPNAARRKELQDKISGARTELTRISNKMDQLAAERERLGTTTSGSSVTAAEHRAERLNEIRNEINGLRSAGGYISQSIPIWQKELDGLK